jgi:hypothetical protein
MKQQMKLFLEARKVMHKNKVACDFKTNKK